MSQQLGGGGNRVAGLGEAALRAVVEANFAICYKWDLQDDSIILDGDLHTLLGLSADDVPSTSDDWLRLVHPDDVAKLDATFDEAVATSTSIFTEYRMLRNDGGIVVVEDGGLVFTDERDRHRFVVGALRDITAERYAQRALQERTTALRVLLEQRRQDRIDIERTVTDNLRNLVLPTLDRLARSLRSRPEAAQLSALRTTLEEIVAPFSQFAQAANDSGEHLTRREYEVIQLIRAGKTSGEIAETLHIGASTVTYHRQNIRRKLGLGPRAPHLSAYLAARLGEKRERHDPLELLLEESSSAGTK